MKAKNLLPLIPAALFLLPLFFPLGCANTTTPPTGGPKDTIPPVITKVSPLPGTVNVPTHGTKLVFTFNEYVKIKEANSIYLSPPMEKKPKSAIHGKSVVVTFEEDLEPNTTYYYCAQALCILSFGWGEWYYSGVKSFTTLPK